MRNDSYDMTQSLPSGHCHPISSPEIEKVYFSGRLEINAPPEITFSTSKSDKVP